MVVLASRKGHWAAAVVLLAAGLAGCSTPPPPPPPPSKAPPVTSLQGQMVRVSFAELPGWRNDSFEAALAAFGHSCDYFQQQRPDRWSGSALGIRLDDLENVCRRRHAFSERTAREFFEAYFVPYRVGAAGPVRNILSSYASPQFKGHRPPCSPNSAPLYRKPAEGVFSREEISRGALKGREIACVDDPVDAFNLQIQGAGSLLLPDGRSLALATDGTNGLPPKMPSELGTSLEQLRHLIARDRDAAIRLMNGNPRYTYYAVARDPVVRGAMGKPLTAERSLAVDASLMPYGLPVWLDAQDKAGRPVVQRLMFAQDTGSKITGVARGDYYMGSGAAAMAQALQFWYQTAFYILLPHAALPVAVEPPRAPAGPLAATAAEVRPVRPAAVEGAFAQLGIFSTAQAAQKHLDTALPQPMRADLAARVEQVDGAGGRTLFRAVVTGFAGEAAAREFCTALRAKSVDCLAKSR